MEFIIGIKHGVCMLLHWPGPGGDVKVDGEAGSFRPFPRDLVWEITFHKYDHKIIDLNHVIGHLDVGKRNFAYI